MSYSVIMNSVLSDQINFFRVIDDLTFDTIVAIALYIALIISFY
jgi:hypothetical protein